MDGKLHFFLPQRAVMNCLCNWRHHKGPITLCSTVLPKSSTTTSTSPQSHCSINHLLARCQDTLKYTVTKIKWMKWISSEYKCNEQPQMCPFVMVQGPYLLLIYKITVINKNSYSVSTVRGLRRKTVYYIYIYIYTLLHKAKLMYWSADIGLAQIWPYRYIALHMQQI